MKKLFFVVILLGSSSLKCKKDTPKFYPPGPYLPPHSLLFLIEKDGNPLINSVLDNLKLSYKIKRFLKKDEKKYIDDFLPAIAPLDSMGIMTTRSIGIISAKGKKIKTYYLEYPDGDVDTLFVNYEYIPRAHADTTACYCLYPLREVKFNGREAHPDSSIKVQRVFLFKK